MLPVMPTALAIPNRRPINIPAAAEESKMMSIAKDWLAGGVSAGLSKTVVAPIGKSYPSASIYA